MERATSYLEPTCFIKYRIPFEGGVVEWCVVVKIKRRRATVN